MLAMIVLHQNRRVKSLRRSGGHRPPRPNRRCDGPCGQNSLGALLRILSYSPIPRQGLASASVTCFEEVGASSFRTQVCARRTLESHVAKVRRCSRPLVETATHYRAAVYKTADAQGTLLETAVASTSCS